MPDSNHPTVSVMVHLWVGVHLGAISSSGSVPPAFRSQGLLLVAKDFVCGAVHLPTCESGSSVVALTSGASAKRTRGVSH